MKNKTEHGGTTGNASGELKTHTRLGYGILASPPSATGAPAPTANTTPDTNGLTNSEAWDLVESIPVSALIDYFINKHGTDWVIDADVHTDYFSTIVCMKLQYKGFVESVDYLPPNTIRSHSPHVVYQKAYRVRRYEHADS